MRHSRCSQCYEHRKLVETSNYVLTMLLPPAPLSLHLICTIIFQSSPPLQRGTSGMGYNHIKRDVAHCWVLMTLLSSPAHCLCTCRHLSAAPAQCSPVPAPAITSCDCVQIIAFAFVTKTKPPPVLSLETSPPNKHRCW